MSREVLYSSAINADGNITLIENALKGTSYYCPLCKNEFILRKSGKSGKGSRRPHFAHNEVSPNCTPEGVLHYSFKRLLLDTLNRQKAENGQFPINWRCSVCHQEYNGNLLERVTAIQEEYDLTECRPDIALLDGNMNVVAVIEIVVTHEPEPRVLDFYERNHLILVQLDVGSEDDLRRIEDRASKPNLVRLCLNPNCKDYSQAVERQLIIGTRTCNTCLHTVQACRVRTMHPFGIHYSTDFNENEKVLAQSKGVRFETKINSETQEQYSAIICLNCRIIRSKYRNRRF